MKWRIAYFVAVFLLSGGMMATAQQVAKPESGAAAGEIPSASLMQPEALAKILQAPGEKPLILHVGFQMLYRGGHIAGSEYAGPASEKSGLELLRARVKSLPRHKAIVLYCGCCPWEHCPNVHPAFATLREMGFTNVKVLYIAENFRTNWVEKGYPMAKGAE